MTTALEPLTVLIAEDLPDDAELLLHELRGAGYEVSWQRVDTEADFLAGLETRPDIILSDYAMPRFGGLRALELARARCPGIPFILVSGTMGEESAVEAVKRGAVDYLLKDRIARLGPAVRRALQEVAEGNRRKELEAQFIEAQKMEVLGQLASGVAHDFNNILMTIMGYNELIAGKATDDGAVQEYSAEIRHASERAAGLTRQLLVFSRKEKVLPVILNLNDLVSDLEKMLRRLLGENIEMTLIPGSERCLIRADSGYVGQVLMNLAVNARDAMPQGGKLNISVSETGPDNSMVALAVTDNGTGMTEEVKTRLFEAFFTTKPKGKGTGLGLATCQTIVQQSGGRIEVESEPGRGTTFRVLFPRAEGPVAGIVPAGLDEPIPGGTETLMVVEDEGSVRDLACGVLESRGYHVLRAANGWEALHLARSQKDPPVELVVTDVIMPVMDGKMMAAWLRAAIPKIKILFTSGYIEEALEPEGAHDPGVEYLPKPYSPATLARKVREMLNQ